MIGFAPFDEPPPPPERKRGTQRRQMFQNERTECNYIVLFFVVGVLLLAVRDVYRL